MLGAVHDNPGSRSVTVKVTCSCTGAWVVCKLSWGFTSKIGGHCRWKNIVTKIVFFLLLHLTGFESDLRTFWKRNNEFLGMITCHEGFSSWADTKIYGTFLVFLGLGYLVPVIFGVPNITRSRNCGERLSESYTSIISKSFLKPLKVPNSFPVSAKMCWWSKDRCW